MFLLEFTQIKRKTYEMYTSWRCETFQCKMQALMKLIGLTNIKCGKKKFARKQKLKLNVQL